MSLQNKYLRMLRNRMFGLLTQSGILSTFVMPALAQLNINYRKSSIVDEFRLCGGKHRNHRGIRPHHITSSTYHQWIQPTRCARNQCKHSVLGDGQAVEVGQSGNLGERSCGTNDDIDMLE